MAKQIFEGKLLNLYLERRRFPNGQVVDLEVVKHPGAALIVPFLRRNRIVLIRQYRPVINSYIWELPAGTFHPGESPLRCAKRELIEEIGYTALRWRLAGHIYPAPGYTDERIIIYEARNLKKVGHQREADEVIVSRLFSAKAILKLLKAGRIVDAKTICALTLAGVV